MLGYKVAKNNDTCVVVTLEIPEDAITNINRNNVAVKEYAKHRCNKAKVLKSEDKDGKEYKEAKSSFYAFPTTILYKVNEVVEVDDFDMDLEKVCSSGIHFFLTKSVAENYMRGCDNNFTGILNHYLDDGTLCIQTSYVDGKKNGIQIRYISGRAREEYSYVNDIIQGIAVSYNKEGEIINKTVYADNKAYTTEVTKVDNINSFANGIVFGGIVFGGVFSSMLITVAVGAIIKKLS